MILSSQAHDNHDTMLPLKSLFLILLLVNFTFEQLKELESVKHFVLASEVVKIYVLWVLNMGVAPRCMKLRNVQTSGGKT